MFELLRESRNDIVSIGSDSTEILRSTWDARDPNRPLDDQSYVARLRGNATYWLRSWQQVFSEKRLSADLIAGLTVATVALPLNIALSVAAGLPASVGLIAGAIGGGVAACFGGSKLQVSGPSTALNVMILAIATKWGVEGVFAGAILVGLLQLAFFYSRASTYARLIPEAVLVGFTTGVGIKLLDQQIPQLLDVDLPVRELLQNLANPLWLHDVQWLAVMSGLVVITFMLGLAKFPKFPSAIIGLAIATGISSYLGWEIHRVGAVPSSFPIPGFPEHPAEEWFDLFISCIPLAILATTESLLSAKGIDRITETKKEHDPNLETFGQALGNIASGFFGGMVVSGAIVRSSVNVQSGGRTRISSIFHASLLLLAPIFAAKWIGAIPIAALAGLLCLVGYRLVEVKTFFQVLRGSKLQAIAFVIAATAVVTGKMSIGLVLALSISGLDFYLKGLIRRNAEKRKYGREPQAPLPQGIRAQIGTVAKKDLFYRAKPAAFRLPEENWEAHVNHAPVIHPTAFVHENASLIGRVILSPGVHVAAEVALRADEGTPFFVGSNTNIQDGVVLHALKRKWVKVGGDNWAIYIGERVSLAHQALIHGPSYVGDDTFIGFKAIIHDSVIGKNCYVGIGAIVVGVDIADGRYVPHGMLVDTAEKAQALGPALDAHHHFNEDVVEVNIGLGEAYRGDWLLPKTSLHKLKSF
ncbi:MAG: hypothetical protein H7301_02170 [Cryobacterium sp.]|nr:hypothetical protein [Oligoflexia bacterium]